ncbi:MAG TPA: OmpA family protein [Candidatus Kapabacteria bacterium]|nr:OmpA family protein [Candidatus Kapabacteria bacterium]
MSKFRFLFPILFVMVFFSSAYSQTNIKMPINIGITGGLGLNMHNPDWTDHGPLTGRPLRYNQTSTAIGYYGGIIANFPINDIFTISARIGYNNLNGTIKATATNGIITESNTIDTRLEYFEVSPILELHNLLPVKNIYLLVGLELATPFTAEGDVTYTENSTPSTWSRMNTPMEDKVPRVALAVGAGYVIPLSKNVFLTPEASFRFGITNISSESSWTVNQLRLGVSLTFGLSKYEEEPTEQSATYRTLTVNEPSLRYYDKNMDLHPLAQVKVEEVQYSELHPLIPYVFFPEGKSTPTPSSQVLSAESEAGEFNIENLPSDAEQINTYTLDIVGSRLKSNPGTNLTVTGTINSNEMKNNQKYLAKERGDFVRNYLVANYSGDPNKITVVAGTLPAKPSSKVDPDGDAENCRAEIASTNPEILKPIIVTSDKERVSDPALIEFYPNIVTNDTILNWELIYFQSGTQLKRFVGSGHPSHISWQIAPNLLKASQVPIDYQFNVETMSGLKKGVEGSIPVDFVSYTRKKSEDLPDRSISKFSLVLFDFDSDVINDKDKQTIDQYVIPAIKANSTVQVYGYTDRIGDEDYNKKLAQRRANNVQKYIASKVKNVKFETIGIGEGVQIFNNDTPTGRQLSRTVQIYVITPKS